MRSILTRRGGLALLAALPFLAALPHAKAQTRDKVVVASKIDTEGGLLGNMIALVLEKQGVPVENRVQLGPTKVVRTAILSGEIDIYPEYTGNGAFFHGMENDPAWKSAASAFETAKRLDAGEEQARLARSRAGQQHLAHRRARRSRPPREPDDDGGFREARRNAPAPSSSRARPSSSRAPAALPSFEQVYAFKLPRDQIVVLPGGDTAVTMRAAAQSVSGVNAAMVYGTDGAIAALDLVVMDDNKGAQIVYEPAPVIRAEVLQKLPGHRAGPGAGFSARSR